ncbi:uncharacterized protein LOC117581099 isoform X1 [Drosophila guanche]|uniref:Uncharacterized protein n=1 Tax=Drosophila guanche TaxID=7266 RepID=A0A3B0JYM5_DROGU|nr:uncharacterized protein LOC117581099 isoform X1 [Drosophila guanche]SPP78789.1 Hypothetical predicted protein [Drosophila guanche]
MNSKVNSLEEKVKLPPTETISRCYQPQQSNRKVIRILTVAVYVLCVSLAAIMLSLYYIFIWDPTIRPFVTKANHCDKIVIPEKIAIRLLNSSEVTAEQFYKHILEQYRIHNHLQQQRQQFLQKQHLQLQQLEANNRFQEIFATATIIQAHPHPHSREPPKKPLLVPSNSNGSSSGSISGSDLGAFRMEPPASQPSNMEELVKGATAGHHLPMLLDTSPPADSSGLGHIKRKTHRGHYKHHRARAGGSKKLISSAMSSSATASTTSAAEQPPATAAAAAAAAVPHGYMDTPLNPAAGTIVQQPQLQLYTSMPIPLILSPSEEKRPSHHAHNHAHGERRGGAQARKRTTTASVSGYDSQTYLNPFLTGELIFEK